jgi:hypothetical protein
MESDLAGSSDSAFSAFSFATNATATSQNGNGRNGQASRMGQNRRMFFSDLTSVVERGGSGQVRQNRPWSRNFQRNGSLSNEDAAHNYFSESLRVSRARPQTPSTPNQDLGQNNSNSSNEDDVFPDNYEIDMTEEEQLAMSMAMREEYEAKIKSMQHNYENMIIGERGEMMRINREYQERFDEIRQDMTHDASIFDTLSEGQQPMLDVIRHLFPRGRMPGKASKGVQCDIEPGPVSRNVESVSHNVEFSQ